MKRNHIPKSSYTAAWMGCTPIGRIRRGSGSTAEYCEERGIAGSQKGWLGRCCVELISSCRVQLSQDSYLAVTTTGLKVCHERFIHFDRGFVHRGLLDRLTCDVDVVVDEQAQDILGDDLSMQFKLPYSVE